LHECQRHEQKGLASQAASDSIGAVLTPKRTMNLCGWLCLLAWFFAQSESLAGNRILAQFGTGRTVQTSYDALNRPETIAEAGRLTVYGYDLAGRAAVMIGGNGQVTENVYDEAGRLTNRTLFRNLGNRTETGVQAEFGWAHDAVGNVTAQHEKWPGEASRPAGVRTTAMTYDGANRLYTEIISDPSSGVTSTTNGYDAANNRKSKTVTGGAEPGYWSYDYNEANQLVAWEKRTALGGTVMKEAVLAYDANGNRVEQMTGGVEVGNKASVTNQGITYEAAEAGFAGNEWQVRLCNGGSNAPLSAAVQGQEVVVNLAADEGVAGSLEIQGLTFTEVVPGSGASIEFRAADAGNQALMVTHEGSAVVVRLGSSEGDRAVLEVYGMRFEAVAPSVEGNMVNLTFVDPGAAEHSGGIQIQGNDIIVTLRTNEDSEVVATVAEVLALIDAAASHLVTTSQPFSGNVSPLERTYLHGGGANMVVTTTADALRWSIPETVVRVSGGGDVPLTPIPQTMLGGVDPVVQSTADEVVELLETMPELENLLTVTGGGTHVVQPAGPLALSGGGAATAYEWDAQDRLTRVVMPDGKAYHYTYDYRTRRIGTEREASGGAAEQHTAIVFSGGLSLAEYESTSTQTSIANPAVTSVHYVRGPDMGGGVGGLLYSLRGGAPKYNLSNGRGDIVAQSDASAALTWTASYEAGGKRTTETGTNADKHRANSKDEDPTGLLNEGFRYRDLETMVWLSRDPAGFVDGPNLYAYVKQNPWSKFDARGLGAGGAVKRLLKGGDEAAGAAVQKVNGRYPIHKEWANQKITPDKLPATIKNRDQILDDYPYGVMYSSEGRADFTPYSKVDLKFKPGELVGETGPDTSAARTMLMNQNHLTMEQVMELEKDHVWHHVEGGQGMQLVPSDLHDAYKHTGGRADIKEGNFFEKVGAFFGGIFASRTKEAKANGENVDSAKALDAATYLPVIGDGVDIVATGAEIVESELGDIITGAGSPGTNGYERAKFLNQLKNDN
jgi:RHS repeat-associated protein